MGTELTPEAFGALFERFTRTAFRLETLQRYDVADEQDEFEAFLQGAEPAERSPDTSPWLRRIRDTTAAGKRWQRVHLVDHPLSDYLRYEIAGYRDNAAAGEEIFLADRSSHPDLARLDRDFWLLDDVLAVVMHYDSAGRFLRSETSRSPDVLTRCQAWRDLALRHAVPLDEYLATNEVE